MKTETIKLLKFDELSQEAKERAINSNREINSIDDFSWVFDNLKQNIKEKTALDLNNINIDENSKSAFIFCDNGEVFVELRKKFKELNNLEIDNKFGVWFSYMGSCNRSVIGEIELLNYEEAEQLEYDFQEAENKKIKEEIENILLSVLDCLKEGYQDYIKSINYNYSDEGIAETLRANEYDFLENGERF